MADTSAVDKLRAINHALTGIPSYSLSPTLLSGPTLKLIYTSYKNLGIDLDTILPVSQAGLYRQFAKPDVDLSLKDSLVSVIRLVNKGMDTFVEWPDFKEWLFSRVENLANRRPIDLLALQTGRYEVELALDRIEYGLYG